MSDLYGSGLNARIFCFRLNQQMSKNTDLKDEIDELLFWMDETEALLTSYVDPCDHSAVSDLAERFKVRLWHHFMTASPDMAIHLGAPE